MEDTQRENWRYIEEKNKLSNQVKSLKQELRDLRKQNTVSRCRILPLSPPSDLVSLQHLQDQNEQSQKTILTLLEYLKRMEADANAVDSDSEASRVDAQVQVSRRTSRAISEALRRLPNPQAAVPRGPPPETPPETPLNPLVNLENVDSLSVVSHRATIDDSGFDINDFEPLIEETGDIPEVPNVCAFDLFCLR